MFDRYFSISQGIIAFVTFFEEFYGIHTLYYVIFNKIIIYEFISWTIHLIFMTNLACFLGYDYVSFKKEFMWIFYTDMGLACLMVLAVVYRSVVIKFIKDFYKGKLELNMITLGIRDPLMYDKIARQSQI